MAVFREGGGPEKERNNFVNEMPEEEDKIVLATEDNVRFTAAVSPKYKTAACA